ncbi:dihydrofolate reductase-like [Xenia sp. Carnegie-2017]|uniref:dihydrofolate reductase-like n=1 Tax=Xenia sp. Carnegie-2017 TaxID=2897299 RepID=UPI001F035AA6|nr:dihydrofolate reductase-like [Xenia sp. Carnegie-2017]
MKYFSRITTDVKHEGKQNAVIMGRKTWESIPTKYRPMAGRLNVILSKTMSEAPDNVLLYPDLATALDALSQAPYVESIESLFIVEDMVFIRNFKLVNDPTVPSEMQEENGVKFQYFVYEKKTKNGEE